MMDDSECEKPVLTASNSFVPFDWEKYLEETDCIAASEQCFFQEKQAPVNSFKEGHLLLAQDKHAANLTVLCKVRLIHKCWIYIHIEGLDETHCRWVMCDDLGLAPIGSFDPNSKVDSRGAYPPTGLKPTFKKWIALQYKGQEEWIAPENLFKPINKKRRPPSNLFEIGMKVAAYDEKSFDGKLAPASVVEVEKHNVKINFDGWPSSFDVTVPYDSRCLYPTTFTNISEIEVNIPKNIVAVNSKGKLIETKEPLKKSTKVGHKQPSVMESFSPSPTPPPRSKRSPSEALSGEYGVKRKAVEKYGRPTRPGQRAAAFKEQVTGVKAKVFDILRSANLEQQRDANATPPPHKVEDEFNEEKMMALLSQQAHATPQGVTYKEPGSNHQIVLSAVDKRVPQQATVHPSMRPSTKYKLTPSTSTPDTPIESKIFAATGISAAPNLPQSINQPMHQNPNRLLITKPSMDNRPLIPRTSAPRMDEYIIQNRNRVITETSIGTVVTNPRYHQQAFYKRPLPTVTTTVHQPKLTTTYDMRKVKKEEVKRELKGIMKNKDKRISGAYIQKNCRVGPLLNRNKINKLADYGPRHYAQLQLAIVQDLINCAYVQKEVFDLVRGTSSGPTLKVCYDSNGMLMSKEIPIFLSPATTWMYIRDLLHAINACPNLITSSEFSCDACASSGTQQSVDPEDDEIPKERIVKYKREYDVLQKLGATLPGIAEVGEEFRKRLGDEVADMIIQNEIDGAVLPYCQEDILREHMNLSHGLALRIAAVACELRAKSFDSVPGIEHMDLEL